MKPKAAILLTFIVFAFAKSYAGNLPKNRDRQPFVKQFINHKDWNFVENKGQVADNQIKYYGHQGGVYLYCKPGKISFVFTKSVRMDPFGKKQSDQISEATCQPSGLKSPFSKGAGGFDPMKYRPSKITTARSDLTLINSNPSASIEASDKQEYYENYYTTGNADSGIINVHTYKTITYKNIYPHIDLILHSREEGMKYEFVVYSGGKVGDIQMHWEGIEKIKRLKDFGIEYSCSLGKITESAPYSYQGIAENVGAGLAPAQSGNMGDELGYEKGDREGSPYEIKIESHFVLKNNIIGFKTSKYDKTKPLVIDPYLEWGTYFGGGSYGPTWQTAVSTDTSGNVFVTGNTNSISGIASSGAYLTSYAGGDHDAFIVKFSGSGQRLWATYYGGDDDEAGVSISNDNSGNAFITGWTKSSNGIATSGSYQSDFNYFNENQDGFIAKFSGSGNLIWATYCGSIGTGIITDIKSENIYVAGGNDNGSPLATSGAYRTTVGQYGGAMFLAKFNTEGNIIWATYYGPDSYDDITSICLDGGGNVYITGGVQTNGGIATVGAYQTYIHGMGDAFLSKFSSSGNLLWGTYFGKSGSESGESVCTDNAGNVYITGYTDSPIGLATKGAYQTSYGGSKNNSANAFLAKFSNSGNLIWSTYYGNKGGELAYAACTDALGNVYISGQTNPDSGGLATKGAYQANNVGYEDAFIAKFSGSCNLLWATYYGGIRYTIPTGMTTDRFENVYISGITYSDSLIATSGVYQTSFYNNGPDAFLAKFGSEFPDVGIFGFTSPIDSICKGQNKLVIVKLKNYGTPTFISATLHWTINGKLQDSVLWIGNIPNDSAQIINLGIASLNGNDTIVAWTTLNNGIDPVPSNDTGKVIVYAYSGHFSGVRQGKFTICTGTHVRIGNNPIQGNSYSWMSQPLGYTSTLSNPIVEPDSFTTYYLTETNNATGCTNTDSSTVIVKVVKAPVANAGKSHAMCFGDSTLIGSADVSGLSYLWSSYPVGFSNVLSDIYVKPIITTIYTVQVTNVIGCTDISNDTITVNHPKAITGPAESICSGSGINLGTIPFLGHTYSWTSNPTGFSSSLSNPVDTPKITTIFNLKETIDSTGCSDSDSVKITVVPHPDVLFTVKNINGYLYQFSAQSPNYPSWQYHWDFGDTINKQADTISGYTVSHTYPQNGRYLVTLTVSLPVFCTVTDTYTVFINLNFSLNIFPNAFGLQTDINYTLTNAAHIRISITDEIGR